MRMTEFVGRITRVGNSKGVIIPHGAEDYEYLNVGEQVKIRIEKIENMAICQRCGRKIGNDEYAHIRFDDWLCDECFTEIVRKSERKICKDCPQRMMDCDPEQYEICMAYMEGKASDDYGEDIDTLR